MRRVHSPSLQLLARAVRTERGRLATAVGLSLVGAASGVVTPLLVSRLITALGEHRTPVRTLVELVVVVLVGAFTGGWSAYLLSAVGERAVAGVRIALLRHIVRLPVPTVRTLGSGELSSRVGTDAAALRSITDNGVAALPVSALLVAAYLTVMGVLDWVLLLVVLATFAVAALAIRAFLAGMRQGVQSQQAALGLLAQAAQSVIGNVTTIKAYCAETSALVPLEEHTRASADAAIRTARAQAAISPLMGLGQQIAMVGVLAVGGVRVASGALGTAAFIAFLMYLFQLINPLMTLAQGAGRIQLGVAAAARMDTVLAAPAEHFSASADSARPGAVTAQPGPVGVGGPRRDPAVALSGVCVDLAGTRALDGLSLQIPPTGMIGIVGPSGAGKSTVLNVVERFVEPQAGAVELFGVAIGERPLAEVRRRLALVEQGSTVLTATIRRNLCLGHTEELGDMPLYEVLTAVGLADAVRALPHGLDSVLGESARMSGGEQQRLCLARALLTDADVLLLDEPTAHLDGANEARLVALLHDVARHRAVVVVAHRLSTVRDAATIYVLSDGRLVAAGTHAKLLATCSAYRDLVATDAKGA